MTQKILKIDADGLPGDTVEFFHNDGVFTIKMRCPEFRDGGTHLTDRLSRGDIVRLRDWLAETLGEG